MSCELEDVSIVFSWQDKSLIYHNDFGNMCNFVT
jgi:hypothetical protein